METYPKTHDETVPHMQSPPVLTVNISQQEMTITVSLLIHEQFDVSLSDSRKLRNEFLLLKCQHFRNRSMNKCKFVLCVNNEKKKKIFLKPNKLSWQMSVCDGLGP